MTAPAQTTVKGGAKYEAIYACRLSDGRRVRLDDREGPTLDTNQVYGPIRAAGAQVVFISNELTDQASSGQTSLLRLDMDTNRDLAIETIDDDCACWTDIVVQPTGGLAWIRYSGGFKDPRIERPERSVRRCDTGCRTPTTLASGRRIEPRSLSLSGRRLTWRDGGQLRSAYLRW